MKGVRLSEKDGQTRSLLVFLCRNEFVGAAVKKFPLQNVP